VSRTAVSDAGLLIAWLLDRPCGRPVEERGATAALTAVSGKVITADVHLRYPRELTQLEQRQLQALGITRGHERRATLRAGTVRAAAVTAVLLPHRIPDDARKILGIWLDGTTAPGRPRVPLGAALAGNGVRREPLEVVPTPGEQDDAGRPLVIRSSARLWLGAPIAVVTEQVYGEFLDAYPGPWPPQ
jgi:hypothetical protein